MSYIGDEQAPISGALHILQDKNLFSLRNLNTVYYGPVFSIIALPAIVADYATKYFNGLVSSAEDYKNFILWSWGGIVIGARLIALSFGLFGLVALYHLLMTRTINPKSNKILALVGVSILATNFYYFEYANFFKHWIFILSLLIAQIYCAIKIAEGGNVKRYWWYSTALFLLGFGISYISLLFQILWLPFFIKWVIEKEYTRLKEFSVFIYLIIIGILVLILWHPYGFFRIIGLTTDNIVETNTFSALQRGIGGVNSFQYYLGIIYNNHQAFLVAWLLLTSYLSLRCRILLQYWFWVPLFPSVATLVVFGLLSHHEARYVLPTLVMIFVHLAMVLVFYFSLEKRQKLIDTAIITLLIFLVIFHTIHISQWARIMTDGPQEQQVISNILSLQEKQKDSRTLFLQYYILGRVHTKDAYKDYMARFDKAKYNLYKTIAKTSLPVGIEPLNVYYYRPDELPLHSIEKNYDYVFYRYEPYYSSYPFDPQFDFMESSLVRLWFYKDFRDRYIILKQ